MAITLNKDYFIASMTWGLKALPIKGMCLDETYIEIHTAKAFGMEHTGKSNDYADGVLDNVSASIKSIKLDKQEKVRAGLRDFINTPDFYFKPRWSKANQYWHFPIQVVQRRQELEDEDTMTPEQIGIASINGFREKIEKSHVKYGTQEEWEILVVHGYGHNNQYLFGLYWQQYQHLDPTNLTFARKKKDIQGFQTIEGQPYLIMDRVNGNARQGTCFREYKSVDKYENKCSFVLNLPQTFEFNEAALRQESKAKIINEQTLKTS